MFSLREYIKKGFLDAVGKMSDYQIILNSAGWMEKGVLTEDDLVEINAAIEAQYVVNEPVIVEGEEDTTEEVTVAESGESESESGASDELLTDSEEDGEPLT